MKKIILLLSLIVILTIAVLGCSFMKDKTVPTGGTVYTNPPPQDTVIIPTEPPISTPTEPPTQAPTELPTHVPTEKPQISDEKSMVISLMYHKITEDPTGIGAFVVYPETFENDILYLKSEGYEFCFASEADEILNGEKPVGKYVIITFDDGYESDYIYALPILQKHNVKATFFVTGAWMGTEDFITKEHLAELAKSDLVEIGNHTFKLHTKTVEEIRTLYSDSNIDGIIEDFVYNARYLEEITGRKITVASYPNGIWKKTVDAKLRNLGYETTFSSEERPIEYAGLPCGRLNRYFDAKIDELIQIQADK